MVSRDFLELVYAMRDAQRLYSKSRSSVVLQEARSLERRIDEALDDLLKPPSLPLEES